MKELTMGALHKEYRYPGTSSSTINSGKIESEKDVVSGEEIAYQYDSLNRLSLAETTTGSSGTQWGQSFAYDGFGNLTTVSNTKGAVPTLSVSYSASTNRRSGDCADASGNLGSVECYGPYVYDAANRISAVPGAYGNPGVRYSYAPGNKRVWRGVWVSSAQTVDELTYYSAGGAKLVAYNLTVSGSYLRATASGEYYEYFGGKLLKNSGGWVNQDRLGSIGKYYPYGQERGTPLADGQEKFATYTRDAETGLDYAQNRYHDPGDGRFMTTDPFSGSARAGDPGSWNRYAYVGGDPANRNDPSGEDYCSYSDNICVQDHQCLDYSPWAWIKSYIGSDITVTAEDPCGGYHIGPYGTPTPWVPPSDSGDSGSGGPITPAPDVPVNERAQTVINLFRGRNPGGFVNAAAAIVAGEALVATVPVWGPAVIQNGQAILTGLRARWGLVWSQPILVSNGVRVGTYVLSGTVAGHLNDVTKAGQIARPYLQSPLLINQIVSTGTRVADTAIRGAFRYDVPGKFNGSNGTWELVIDPRTNTIFHFLFKSN